MTPKWFAPPTAPVREQEFRLPGIGVIRVNLDKHIEAALKSQTHEFAGKREVTVRSDSKK